MCTCTMMLVGNVVEVKKGFRNMATEEETLDCTFHLLRAFFFSKTALPRPPCLSTGVFIFVLLCIVSTFIFVFLVFVLKQFERSSCGV